MKSTTRTERFEARISPDALAILRRAAELSGRSLSDFVVGAAEREARRTIEEAAQIKLSGEEQRRFVKMLLEPGEPSPALRRARSHHADLFGEG